MNYFVLSYKDITKFTGRIMPSSAGYVRDYKQESITEKRRNGLKKNGNRKKAKRAYEKAKGKTCKGDVHHKDGNTNNNALSNLSCVSKSKNRSFPRNSKGGKKIKRKGNEAQNARAYR